MAGQEVFRILGLPDWFAWVVVAYETLGGLALIFGVYARWLRSSRSPPAVCRLSGPWRKRLDVYRQKRGWEYPVFWAIACFALALVGDGAYALKTRRAV